MQNGWYILKDCTIRAIRSNYGSIIEFDLKKADILVAFFTK